MHGAGLMRWPQVINMYIQAAVSYTRVAKFLAAPEVAPRARLRDARAQLPLLDEVVRGGVSRESGSSFLPSPRRRSKQVLLRKQPQ